MYHLRYQTPPPPPTPASHTHTHKRNAAGETDAIGKRQQLRVEVASHFPERTRSPTHPPTRKRCRSPPHAPRHSSTAVHRYPALHTRDASQYRTGYTSFESPGSRLVDRPQARSSADQRFCAADRLYVFDQKKTGKRNSTAAMLPPTPPTPPPNIFISRANGNPKPKPNERRQSTLGFSLAVRIIHASTIAGVTSGAQQGAAGRSRACAFASGRTSISKTPSNGEPCVLCVLGE